MLAAATKEEILSTSGAPHVFFLAAREGAGENSRLGFGRKTSAPHQGSELAKSRTALGDRRSLARNTRRMSLLPQTPTPPHIGTPKTSSQCSIYLQGGTTSGSALNFICRELPNGPRSQQMRGCLQTLYSPTSGYLPLPLFIFLPGNSLFDLNSIIPGAGAHATCAADALQ